MPSVAELMTPGPTTIEPDAAALAALDLMIDSGIRHLPVVDRRGSLIGVLSVDDLRAAFPFSVSLRRPPSVDEREGARDLSVAEVMTHGPLTTTPKTSVAEAAGTLARFRIGCLPVVDAGRLVGILSETDVLRSLAGGTEAGSARRPDSRVQELETLVTELRAERTRILRQLGRVQQIELEATREMREVPMDEAERAAHSVERLIDEPLAALSARRLEALDHALFRAKQGRLGHCESCGKEIPVARLRALPGTAVCVRCARSAA
ncbi:MAG: CBS domain-containing protein [Deltaproteobacteria bacterium]|nr:CBS domain-containing protein [Deltaproteobacteria bacterium]